MTTYPPKQIAIECLAKCGESVYLLSHVTSGIYIVDGKMCIQRRATYRCQSCHSTMQIVVSSKPTAIYD